MLSTLGAEVRHEARPHLMASFKRFERCCSSVPTPRDVLTPDALALLQSGTSAAGYKAATTIMSLEAILKELEKESGPVRNPGWYFVSVFGTPATTGKWGWRIEGHHLSLNFLVDNGQVVSATPCFFGANPATVMHGSRKGTRAIPEVDDLARELFARSVGASPSRRGPCFGRAATFMIAHVRSTSS